MFIHEGLIIRPVEEKDLEAIRMMRNEPSTWTQLTNISHVSPTDQSGWLLSLMCDQTRAYFVVHDEACDTDRVAHWEGDFIGFIRMDDIDRVNRSARVGADVHPGKRGRGYGTRIYKAILKYGFDYLNLHRLWLMVLDTNERAKLLYVNSGFRAEGRQREAIFRDGRYVDYIMMSILEDEYRARQTNARA